ncbi:signal transducing kinase of the PAK [Marasmius tenuissimus]|uniref:Signal transducing kinase of the PAK n=1 Tax=Marasmius tenuissimus TaxID=585030 RepID=A0ABR2ZRE2_9AGAR
MLGTAIKIVLLRSVLKASYSGAYPNPPPDFPGTDLLMSAKSSLKRIYASPMISIPDNSLVRQKPQTSTSVVAEHVLYVLKMTAHRAERENEGRKSLPRSPYTEVLMLALSEHPNVAEFVGSYQSYVPANDEFVGVITRQRTQGVSLTEIIRNNTLDDHHISRVCLEVPSISLFAPINFQIMAQAVGVGVRSLALSSSSEDHPWKADFVDNAESMEAPHWLAPEIARQHRVGLYNDDDETTTIVRHRPEPSFLAKAKADIWSLGITVFEMIEGNPPYHDKPDRFSVLRCIIENGTPTLKNPESCSRELKRFLSAIVCVDLMSRNSATEILESPFLEQACYQTGMVLLLQFKLQA